MVDTPAPQELNQEQAVMRRRARRRLVGAIAIALSAFVVLPILFDPEPRPLGPDVDINIPAPSSPFEPEAAVAPAAPPAPPASGDMQTQTAEPTTPAVAPAEPLPEEEPTETPPAEAKPVESKPAEAKPAEAKPAAAKPAVAKPVVAEEPVNKKPAASKPVDKKPVEKAVTKPVEKAAPAVKPAPLTKPTGAFASHGYLLQLGAFGSENNAKQLQERAKAAGFKTDLNAANGQYRVRVGPYPERERAVEMQNKLKAKGFKSVVLGP